MNNCWINGTLMPASEAKVSVLDHAVLYGDGIFEGLRFYNNKIFRLDAHLKRLLFSAQAIALNIPYEPDQLRFAMEQLIANFEGTEGYLRLVVTRGKGKLGINPFNCETPSVFIIADSLDMVTKEARQKGITLKTASTRRLPPDGLDPKVKSLNYLNHIMARIEAHAAGADEALLLNTQGNVTEASVANVFMVSDNILYTPRVSDGVLNGITRAAVLEAAQNLGVEFREASLTLYDIYTADECFLTGTGAELMAVSEVDGRLYKNMDRPVFNALQQAFWDIVAEEC